MFNTIKDDLTNAIKTQDKFRLSVLRMLKSELQKEEINKKSELNDNDVLLIIKKQVKIRQASKEEYEKYNRKDLADSLSKEMDILKSYLPEELSIKEINHIIDEQFSILKPTNMKDMGRVIKEVSNIIGTKADMALVSRIIKEKLQG